MLKNGFSVAQALSYAIEQPLVDFLLNTPAIVYEGELWVFIDQPEISSPVALKTATHIYGAEVPDTVSAVHYVLTEWVPEKDQDRFALG